MTTYKNEFGGEGAKEILQSISDNPSLLHLKLCVCFSLFIRDPRNDQKKYLNFTFTLKGENLESSIIKILYLIFSHSF